MMNKLLKGVFAASGVMLVASCSDTFDPSGDRVGRILPSVELDTKVASPDNQGSKVRSRAEGSVVSVSDLRLRLTATEGDAGYSYNSPEELYGQDIAVGGYLLEAFYGSDADEGYGKPYYYGSQHLTVLDGKTTPVSLTASLANAIVTVQYSDAVKGYFTSCAATVRTSSGAALDVVNDAAELLYVKPGTVDINVNLVRPTGVAATLNPFSFTAEPRHHYYVTFDINNGAGSGNASLTVTFNSATIDEEVEINISDQVLSAPAPTISLSGVSENMEFIEGSTPAEKLRAVIMAQGGLKTARLYTSSASLLAQGWPAEVDFATATPDQLSALKSLGLSFPGLEGVKTEMGMLDFTDVVKHVAYVAGGDNTTSFNIIAQDNLTKVSEPVSFSFAVSPIELSLGEVEPLYPDATEMALTVAYNGANLAEDVKFSYFNALGVWKELPVKSATPLSRSAATSYRVVLEVPADGDITFKAECGSIVTENVTVTRSLPTHSFSFDSNDVFATLSLIHI